MRRVLVWASMLAPPSTGFFFFVPFVCIYASRRRGEMLLFRRHLWRQAASYQVVSAFPTSMSGAFNLLVCYSFPHARKPFRWAQTSGVCAQADAFWNHSKMAWRRNPASEGFWIRPTFERLQSARTWASECCRYRIVEKKRGTAIGRRLAPIPGSVSTLASAPAGRTF